MSVTINIGLTALAVGGCQICGKTSTYYVALDTRSWFACGSHLPRVLRWVGNVVRKEGVE